MKTTKIQSILERGENFLEPGSSISERAGFKGKIANVFFTTSNGEKFILLQMSGWHQYSRSKGSYIDKLAIYSFSANLWTRIMRRKSIFRNLNTKESLTSAEKDEIAKMFETN